MERCSNEMLKGIFRLCCVARASLGVLLGLVWERVERRGRVERRWSLWTEGLGIAQTCLTEIPLPSPLSSWNNPAILCWSARGPSLVSRLVNTRGLGQLARHRSLKGVRALGPWHGYCLTGGSMWAWTCLFSLLPVLLPATVAAAKQVE